MVNLFADDILLYVKGDNCDDIAKKLQSSTRVLEEWVDESGLEANSARPTLVVKSQIPVIHTW